MLIFGVINYWSVMVQIQQAEHIKNYYLDRVRIEGILTDPDRADLITAMDKIGFNVITIDSPPTRVVRTLNIDASSYPEVWLNITAEFKTKPFMLGLFLGKPDSINPKFTGRALSEYVGT